MSICWGGAEWEIPSIWGASGAYAERALMEGDTNPEPEGDSKLADPPIICCMMSVTYFEAEAT